jgi:hypothetical protein
MQTHTISKTGMWGFDLDSHPGHMTNDLPGPIVPPAREGHRRTFNEADKRRIIEETGCPGASLSEVARNPGLMPSKRLPAC